MVKLLNKPGLGTEKVFIKEVNDHAHVVQSDQQLKSIFPHLGANRLPSDPGVLSDDATLSAVREGG